MMKQEELEKRVIELEEKLDAVTEHSNELEDQVREAFSTIMKMISRYAKANNQIAERVTIELEEKLKAEEESD